MGSIERGLFETPPGEVERAYTQLLDSMGEGFASTDLAGRILEANRSFLALLGYTRAEILRLSYQDITPPRWHAFEQGIIEKQVLTRGYSDIYEKEYRRKDGNVFPVELRTFLLRGREGEPLRMWAIVRDITERKRVESELQASRAFLDRVIDQSPTPTWISDSQGTLLRINKACRELLRLSEEEVLGKYNVFTDNIVERQHLSPLIRRVYEEGVTVQFKIIWDSAELRNISVRRHAAVVLHTTVFPITVAGGRVTNAVFQHVDVTKLTHAELEKSRLESQLLQAQKMESIGRLAGGIAHDFSNMLLVILGYAELLESGLAPDDSLHPYAAEIRKAAERSADITRQLLAFSRKQIIEPQVMDLNALIESLRSAIARLIGEDVELIVTAAADLWRIRGDHAQMSQILVNLAANARDALPSGGHLRIETSNLLLTEEDCRERIDFLPGRYVRLAVADDGAGMDEETLSHLFEPFFTTKTAGQGTGLGLATVYGIVKQNGGAITVDSKPGRGSRFQILLPATDSPVREKVETPAPPPGGEAILLVDDDELVRGTTASMLEATGYRVRTAQSPSEALSLCAEEDFDLVLTDVVMRGMTGVELRDRLARLRPEVPVLLMSGYTEEAIAHRGLPEQRLDLLPKPFNIQTLSRRVGEAIRQGRQRAGDSDPSPR